MHSSEFLPSALFLYKRHLLFMRVQGLPVKCFVGVLGCTPGLPHKGLHSLVLPTSIVLKPPYLFQFQALLSNKCVQLWIPDRGPLSFKQFTGKTPRRSNCKLFTVFETCRAPMRSFYHCRIFPRQGIQIFCCFFPLGAFEKKTIFIIRYRLSHPRFARNRFCCEQRIFTRFKT